MPSGLYSVVVAVADLEAAVAAHARLLERPIRIEPGGHRAVVRVGNTRLELHARHPLAGSEGRDGLERLRLALRAEERGRFEAGLLASPTVPIELVPEPGSKFEPTARPGPEPDSEPGPEPAIGPGSSEAGAGGSGGVARPAAGIVGLDHVVIATRDPERTRAFLTDELGIRLALDRRFPERGLRLLFFRLGGITLELAAALAPAPEEADRDGRTGDASDASESDSGSGDAFHGLAWQVRGLEATHARLAGAGLALSPIRPGHKPGTRVCSLRAPLCGVPTLLIEHPPRPGEGSAPERH
ncbi:MAG: VOC family protein [Myxococcota bacterium]